MIKGAVDFANYHKNNAAQKEAAHKAAEFVRNFLIYGPVSKTPEDKQATIPPIDISVAKLPRSGEQLFGRDPELAQLDGAWADPGTHVISLVAWGGEGKSALVNHWLGSMAKDHYCGARRVYGWSFYSQGIRETVASATEFIDTMLRRFGDTAPTEGSPWDKGERLARLMRKERTLLILDGLEPLQDPPGYNEGRLRDRALEVLVREMAAANPGLCVITTRYRVADIEQYSRFTAPVIELKPLSDGDGAKLLQALGVQGSEEELRQASGEFGGHALALNLLGTYLRDVYAGDVRRRSEVSLLEADAEQGGHARRVMVSYERWFGNGPELAVLRLLGLFDRPADAQAVAAIRARPAISGLTDTLQGLTDSQWHWILARLRRARLIAESDPNQPETLDAHPLVREYFGQQLREKYPATWREGNKRLYDHFKTTTKEYPDTIEEMAPLFTAVTHGCRAGRYQEVLDDIYKRRIQRGNEFFASKKLGAAGAVLSALSSFCASLWSEPVAELSEEGKAYVMFEAAVYLATQLHLKEAEQPYRKASELYEAQKNLVMAAASSGDLSRLYLTIGNIEKAIDFAQKGISLADSRDDLFRKMEIRTYLASALHQAGRLEDAEAIFHQAEEVQKERHLRDPQTHPPLLWSFQGFLYCELLLDQGEYRKVQSRAGQTLEWVTQKQRLPDIALDHLSLGRARLLEAQQEGTGDFSEASAHLDKAVTGLRQSGERHHLPRCLLARTELYRIRGDFQKAESDLNEAMDIARRAGMGLFEADCRLEDARLYLSLGGKEKARESLATAKEMINQMGYHRRDKEIERIAPQL
jgi:tetratricopeptide (TPR) repeat protein